MLADSHRTKKNADTSRCVLLVLPRKNTALAHAVTENRYPRDILEQILNISASPKSFLSEYQTKNYEIPT